MNITEISTDPRIKRLWNEVTSRVQLLEEQSNGGRWGVEILATGEAVVTTCETQYPVECLAHELLHLKFQFDGYRRLRLIIWPADTNGRYGAHLLTALDNELQHHRMYPLFQEMGLEGRRFYRDDDQGTAAYLAKTLRRGDNDFRQPLCDYLTLSAPGGTLTDAQRASFHRSFRLLANGGHAAKFDEIDGILADWRAAPDLNAEPFVRRIIHLFDNRAVAWVGYGRKDEFPVNGFFIGDPFDFQES